MKLLMDKTYLRLPEEIEEGIILINIHRDSGNSIGRKLTPGHACKLKTIIGEFSAITNGIDYLTTKDMTKKLANSTKLTRKDINIIRSSKKSRLTNYWAVMFYLLYKRVHNDNDLKEGLLALANDYGDKIEFSSFITYERSDLGTKATVSELNIKLSKYVGLVRIIFDMIRTNNFNDEVFMEKMLLLKENVSESIFSGSVKKIESVL
jgi:hypothetical protein